jgi:hypothetical protein
MIYIKKDQSCNKPCNWVKSCITQLFGFLTKFASGVRQNQLSQLGDSMEVIKSRVDSMMIILIRQ